MPVKLSKLGRGANRKRTGQKPDNEENQGNLWLYLFLFLAREKKGCSHNKPQEGADYFHKKRREKGIELSIKQKLKSFMELVRTI